MLPCLKAWPPQLLKDTKHLFMIKAWMKRARADRQAQAPVCVHESDLTFQLAF